MKLNGKVKSVIGLVLFVVAFEVLYQNCAPVDFDKGTVASSGMPMGTTTTTAPPPAGGTCSIQISATFGAAYNCPATTICSGNLATFYRAHFTDIVNAYWMYTSLDCSGTGVDYAMNLELTSANGIVPDTSGEGFKLNSPGCQPSGTGYSVRIPAGVTAWGSQHECDYRW